MLTRLITSQWRGTLLLIVALALILPGIGRRDIITSHEARVIQTARLMAARGHLLSSQAVSVPQVHLVKIGGKLSLRPDRDAPPQSVNPWLIPVLNGEIRLQKPPLPYWLSATCFYLFGYSEAAARLPVAILGACSAVLVMGLARRLVSKLAGWFAGLAWISLYFLFDENRKAMADPYLAFFTLLAVWAWVRAATPIRFGDKTSRNRSVAVFYLALALGVLSKGPFILLHVSVPLILYHLCFRRRLPGRWTHHLAGLSLFLLIALPWPIYIITHVPNALELWRYEFVNSEKARPWWFYIPEWLQITLPWTAVWLLAVISAVLLRLRATSARARRRANQLLFPALWWLVIVLIFSAASVKKNAYLLPMMPAAAITVGAGLRRLLAATRRRPAITGAKIIVALQVGLGAGLGLALPWMANALIHPDSRWPKGTSAWATTIAPSLLGLMVAIALPTLLGRWTKGRGWPAAQAIVYAVLVALFFNFVNAPAEQNRSARPACEYAVSLLKQGGRTIHQMGLAEEVSVYLPLDPSSVVPPDSRFSKRVLFIREADVTNNGTPAKPADLSGMQTEFGRVVSGERLSIPGDVPRPRWELYELIVERQVFAQR